jgi:endonuclease YncB( thermonuclease family)
MPTTKKIKKIWDYHFIPLKILDGDTIRAFIDRGGGDWKRGRIRFALTNSIESKDPGGKEATDHLTTLFDGWMGTGNIETDKQMYMISLKYDKYDRYVGMVYYDINDRDDPANTINEKVAATGKSINARMVSEGYAVYVNY